MERLARHKLPQSAKHLPNIEMGCQAPLSFFLSFVRSFVSFVLFFSFLFLSCPFFSFLGFSFFLSCKLTPHTSYAYILNWMAHVDKPGFWDGTRYHLHLVDTYPFLFSKDQVYDYSHYNVNISVDTGGASNPRASASLVHSLADKRWQRCKHVMNEIHWPFCHFPASGCRLPLSWRIQVTWR